MKKLITILCIAAVLANSAILTGCNSDKEVSGNSNNSENSSAVIDNSENSETTESSSASSADPAVKFTGEALELYNDLKVTSFIGPDGETVQASEAVNIYKNDIDRFLEQNGGESTSTILKYDFAYIRNARPYFYYSDEYPDDAKNKEHEDAVKALPEMKWFKVRAGDELGCGLTVKRAEYLHYPTNYLGNALEKMEVEFDGEITLEGVMYANIQPHDYTVSAGDIMFIPDTTKTDGIPAVSYSYWFGWKDDGIFRTGLPSNQPGYPGGYVESDIGEEWHLGNLNDVDVPITGFTNGSSARVRITLKNIIGTADNSMFPYCYFTADIADAVEI